MNIVKIFDRPRVCNNVGIHYGLISIKSIFDNNRLKKLDMILDKFIRSDIFKILLAESYKMTNAKILNVPLCGLLAPEELYAHPILIKSFLRYIDEFLPKTTVMNILLNNKLDRWVNIDYVIECSLVFIVNDVKMPDSIKKTNEDRDYKCKFIKDKNDMFNDDELIVECIKYIINDTLTFLPQCICDLICSMICI
jgi:hypothetical protein